MSKVDTDQGLGPGSESRRRELLDLNSDGSPKSDPKVAETQPGTGNVVRKPDTVDRLLEGFNPDRPDQPRILPQNETTPPPDPVKEITSTHPGKRQRVRTMILASVLTFGGITAFGIGVVKLATNSKQPAPPPTTSTATTVSTAVTPVDTATTSPPPPTITTMEVESLPTAKTASPVMTARPVHTTSAAPPPSTTTTTSRPTGTAPPGMSLLPDDPHR